MFVIGRLTIPRGYIIEDGAAMADKPFQEGDL